MPANHQKPKAKHQTWYKKLTWEDDMLVIEIPKQEVFLDEKQEFSHVGPFKIQLEHSLLSISKWESEWCKPFLTADKKTEKENLDYIRCMGVSQHIDDNVLSLLTEKDVMTIAEYMQSKKSATTFTMSGSSNREVVTSELIYYWMTMFNIPFECQKWHIDRLLTLIRICNVKSAPGKKMSKAEILQRNKTINAQRKKMYNTSG